MFQTLCRATAYLLIFVLTFEHIAFASAQQSHNSANVTQIPSEVYRDRSSYLNSVAEQVDFNSEIYGGFREFVFAMSNPEMDAELAYTSEYKKTMIWKLYANIFYMIYTAKLNRFDQSYKYRDGALKAILNFSESFSTSSNVRDHIILSAYQWALVSAGTVDLNQRKRIDYMISVFVSDLTHMSKKAVDVAKKNETDKIGLAITLSAPFHIFLGVMLLQIPSNSMLQVIFAMTGFLGSMFIWGTLAHRFAVIGPAKYRLKRLVATKILTVFESYQKTLSKAQLKVLPRIINFDTEIASSEERVTRKVENAEKVRKGLLTWLFAQPKSKGDLAESAKPAVPDSNQASSVPEVELSLEQKLREMFLHPVTEVKDVELFFDQASKDGDLKLRISQAIGRDSELRVLALQGRSFREAYLQKLLTAFDAALPFSLDPELEILRRLSVEEKIIFNEKEVEVTLRQAEIAAMEETQQRFHLASDFDFSQLESLKYSSDHWMQIYDYFRKRFFIHQNKEIQKTTPDQINTEDFKSRVKASLVHLREKNFLSGIDSFIRFQPQKTSLLVETQSGISEVLLKEFAEAKITFEVGGPILSKDVMGTERLNGSTVKHFFDFGNSAREKDSAILRDMYNPHFAAPLVINHTVTLKLKNKVLVLSEASFVRLLNELGPEYYSQDRAKVTEERFLVEVARRDAVLADALAFILENPNESPEDLKTRLEQKISARGGRVGVHKTFAEELRSDSSIIRSSDLLNDIRWYGYSIHSDYWRMRDVDANKYAEGVAESIRSFEGKHKRSPAPEEQDRIRESQKKKILQQKEKRFLTWGQKAKQGTVGSAIFLTSMVAITAALVGAMIGFANFMNKPQVPEFVQDLIQMIKPSDGFFSQKDGPIKFQNSDPTNHSKNQMNGGGNDKLRFRVETNLVSMPPYLNLALPEFVSPTSGYNSSDSNKSNEELVRSEKYQRPERYLEIFTLSPIVAHESFLPLPTPSGYRVADINIKYEGEYLRSYDYTVYFNSLSGQNYARLHNPSYEGGYFHLEVSYEPVHQMQNRNSSETWVLDKEALRLVNDQLKLIGETEITSSVDKLIAAKAPVDATSLAQAFGSSAIYTYDREGSSFQFNRLWSDPTPFDHYSKFLRGGTFFYQCSGSNTLFMDYLNLYSEKRGLPDWKSLVAEPIVGFTFEGKNISPIGHQHTLLRTHKPYQYVELDGTPSTMDPKYANEDERNKLIQEKLKKEHERFRRKTQTEAPKIPQAPTHPDIVGILPTRPKIKTVTHSEFHNPYEGPSGSQQFDALDQKIRAAILNYEQESSRNMTEALQVDFLNILSLIPYMRQYLRDGKSKGLIYQYLKLEHRIPLQRKDAAVDRFLESQYQKMRQSQSESELKVIAELGERLEGRVRELHLKIQSSGDIVSPLSSHAEFTSAFFELLGFYRKFTEFEERRIYESGMCKHYFAS